MPGALGTTAHLAVLEAEEIQTLASFCQVHDPSICRLGSKAQFGEDRRQRLDGAFGLPARLAYRVVRGAHQYSASARLPPVEAGADRRAQDGQDDPAVRGVRLPV